MLEGLLFPFMAGLLVFVLLGRIPGPLAAWSRWTVLASGTIPVLLAAGIQGLDYFGLLNAGIGPAGGTPLIP